MLLIYQASSTASDSLLLCVMEKCRLHRIEQNEKDVGHEGRHYDWA